MSRQRRAVEALSTQEPSENGMLISRQLLQDEVEQVWRIDRSEVIERIYCCELGALVRRPHREVLHGWPPADIEKYTPILLDCFDRNGWFHGVFDDADLVAIAVLESEFIGQHKDQLQLKFMHVSNGYRRRGLGGQLFELAKRAARARGAKRLYLSATPSENSIDFYLRLGCVLAVEPDPDLVALEPDDIQLECQL